MRLLSIFKSKVAMCWLNDLRCFPGLVSKWLMVCSVPASVHYAHNQIIERIKSMCCNLDDHCSIGDWKPGKRCLILFFLYHNVTADVHVYLQLPVVIIVLFFGIDMTAVSKSFLYSNVTPCHHYQVKSTCQNWMIVQWKTSMKISILELLRFGANGIWLSVKLFKVSCS